MPCGDPAPEGHKHFLNDKAFAPVGRILLCCPKFPRVLPWAGGSMPLSGAHAAVRSGDCDTTEGVPLLLDYVLYCNGRKCRWVFDFVLCCNGKNAVGIRQR